MDIIFITLMLILFGTLTYNRNFVWKNEITLFSDKILESSSSAISRNNLGLVLKSSGNLERVKDEFIKAKRINPEMPESYVNLGNIFSKTDDIESAIGEYETALKLNRDDTLTHNNLGVCYAKKGNYEEAISEFLKASKLNPLYSSPLINLGRCYIKMRIFDDAERVLKKQL